MKKDNFSIKENIKAMGLVFGDIGTSPIYTLTIIFSLTLPTEQNMFGILSLIFWTMVILVTTEYAWLAMTLSTKGEGGIIVLKEILARLVKKGRKYAFVTFLGYLGVSLLFGDGVITPAISILSAVEGLTLIPGIADISRQTIIIITVIITIILFAVQFKGTDKVSSFFGPIMLLWFLALFIFGSLSLFEMPNVLLAINPYYAIRFLFNHGLVGFFVLSEVILCATGGEALYADMGHIGSKPIRQAWTFVFFALVINYFGQGAFVLHHETSKSILFAMVRNYSSSFYIPFLILTLFATIIASQAMISAIMSLVYQGITTRIFPLMKIRYTSTALKSQIYIGTVNYGLLIAVLLMIFIFRSSDNLAAAYGLAVTATMTISGFFMIWIFRINKHYLKMSAAAIVFIVDLVFLFAVFDKIPYGGYWSIIIASIPLLVIYIWHNGKKAVRRVLRDLDLDTFLTSYEQIYDMNRNIQGTALYLVQNIDRVPAYITHCIIKENIVYEKNIFISIKILDTPYGVTHRKIDKLGTGLSAIEINVGYMEYLILSDILKEENISEKVIFYGDEEILTDKIQYRIFSIMKRISPRFVKFYDFPYNRLHGVVTRFEI